MLFVLEPTASAEQNNILSVTKDLSNMTTAAANDD